MPELRIAPGKGERMDVNNKFSTYIVAAVRLSIVIVYVCRCTKCPQKRDFLAPTTD